jgi:hypothetical protein
MNKTQTIANIQLIQKEFIENREDILSGNAAKYFVGTYRGFHIMKGNCYFIFSLFSETIKESCFSGVTLIIKGESLRITFEECKDKENILQYLEDCQRQISQL